MTDTKLKYTFAVSLLQKLCRDEEGNFVISPLSLGTCLAMLSAGLRGGTQTELLQMFGTLDEEELHSMYSKLLSKKELPLRIANKYLANKDFKIRQQFESLLKEKYESEIECVDFVNDSKEIEARVNAWAAEKTNNMISELLPENTIDSDVILVLLNAVFFKGTWCQEFDPVADPRDFRLRNGEKVQRTFITKKSESFGYGATDKLHLVKIPYKEAGFHMLLAIPKNENEHIDDIIAGMEPSALISALRSPVTRRGKVVLFMPKFKIEYTFGSVIKTLKELGVTEIFVPNTGDFGNLFAGVTKGPYVDPIIHKAVIEVDEKGTTAAAATAVVVRARCMPPRPIIVEVNRPFCFFIMSGDDIVCFNGICANP